MTERVFIRKKMWWQALWPYLVAGAVTWAFGLMFGGWAGLLIAALLIVVLAFWYPDGAIVLGGIALVLLLSWLTLVGAAILGPSSDLTTFDVAEIGLMLALGMFIPASAIGLLSVALFNRFFIVGAPPDQCANCGYSLRGLASARCPECGHVIGANNGTSGISPGGNDAAR